MTEQALISKEFKNPNIFIARFERCRIAKKNTRAGNPFELFEYFVTIQSESRYQGLEFRGTMNVERARKYFTFCNVKTASLVGKLVQVTLHEREYITDEGKEVTTECAYINVLKGDGTPIIMW